MTRSPLLRDSLGCLFIALSVACAVMGASLLLAAIR